MTAKILSIKNLHINSQEKALVNGVSFEVSQGETLCVVGESGSGKTLCSLAAMGLLPEQLQQTCGTVEFCGDDLSRMTHEQRRKLRGSQMAMIFQEPMTSLNPVFTVGDQVAEVFKIHTNLSNSQIKQKVLKLFRKVKIDDPERRYKAFPHELSGGQRQRVMIAMAMALKPKLLIADEPTTALDVTVQGEVLALMNELKREFGTAVLFITHDFGVVKQMADRVVVMQNGEVVEQGSLKQIITAPNQQYTKDLLAAMPKLDTSTKANSNEGEFLQVKDLVKTYQVKKGGFFSKKESFNALKGVSFNMQRGQTVGVVGESGCGKSTLSRAIIGLNKADSGKVVFMGQDISTLNAHELKLARRNMQMVFQDPFSSLNPRMKIGDSVAEGVRAHGTIEKSEIREYVCSLLKDCGLDEDSYDRYPHQFSGGQRQRICIARALALRPALIIADEAVSALDVSVQRQILNLMQGLKRKYNLSYLFVSHDLRVISEVSDKVLVMNAGEIVEQGETSQIFTQPKHVYTKKLLASMPK